MKIVGVGAGGHATVVVDVLRSAGLEVVGLTDRDPSRWGADVLGVPVLGGDDLLPRLRREGIEAAFIGVGSVGDTGPRQRLFDQVSELGFELVTAVHSSAVVAPSVQIAAGVAILAGAAVSDGASLGPNCVVNTAAVIDCGVVLAAHTFIGPGAVLAAGVRVLAGAHIGIGACVREGVTIGEGALVGAGAAVVHDVAASQVVVGVPARVLRSRALAGSEG